MVSPRSSSSSRLGAVMSREMARIPEWLAFVRIYRHLVAQECRHPSLAGVEHFFLDGDWLSTGQDIVGFRRQASADLQSPDVENRPSDDVAAARANHHCVRGSVRNSRDAVGAPHPDRVACRFEQAIEQRRRFCWLHARLRGERVPAICTAVTSLNVATAPIMSLLSSPIAAVLAEVATPSRLSERTWARTPGPRRTV